MLNAAPSFLAHQLLAPASSPKLQISALFAPQPYALLLLLKHSHLSLA